MKKVGKKKKVQSDQLEDWINNQLETVNTKPKPVEHINQENSNGKETEERKIVKLAPSPDKPQSKPKSNAIIPKDLLKMMKTKAGDKIKIVKLNQKPKEAEKTDAKELDQNLNHPDEKLAPPLPNVEKKPTTPLMIKRNKKEHKIIKEDADSSQSNEKSFDMQEQNKEREQYIPMKPNIKIIAKEEKEIKLEPKEDDYKDDFEVEEITQAIKKENEEVLKYKEERAKTQVCIHVIRCTRRLLHEKYY